MECVVKADHIYIVEVPLKATSVTLGSQPIGRIERYLFQIMESTARKVARQKHVKRERALQSAIPHLTRPSMTRGLILPGDPRFIVVKAGR
jgi:hypothetical protein